MLGSLFQILYRPRVTLDELLEERRGGRSWGATFFSAGLYSLFSAILIIFFFHKLSERLALDGIMSGQLDRQDFLFIEVLVISGVAITLLLNNVLSRFFFAWIVQLGLRISAGIFYPREPEERREAARQLRLVHPYTLWISLLPTVLGLIFLTFLVSHWQLPNLNDYDSLSLANQEKAVQIVFSLIMWSAIMQLVSFGMNVYMIVVRTIAIQKIYQLSAARAFWGPFLIYFLIYFVRAILLLLPTLLFWLNEYPQITHQINWM